MKRLPNGYGHGYGYGLKGGDGYGFGYGHGYHPGFSIGILDGFVIVGDFDDGNGHNFEDIFNAYPYNQMVKI
jgi:hypothetical protein